MLWVIIWSPAAVQTSLIHGGPTSQRTGSAANILVPFIPGPPQSSCVSHASMGLSCFGSTKGM